MSSGNYVTLKSLNSLTISLNNSKVDRNSIARLEVIDVVKRFSLNQ
tara:strand:+ start:3621 stop:3758 length:138 start_codon:yes stop_codon:yes gene_type:complete